MVERGIREEGLCDATPAWLTLEPSGAAYYTAPDGILRMTAVKISGFRNILPARIRFNLGQRAVG
jgi:hypothetical protein